MDFFYLLYRLIFSFSLMLFLIRPRFGYRRTILAATGFMLAVWVFNSIICQFKGIGFIDLIYPIIVSLPTFFFFLCVSEPIFSRVLFTFLTVCNFSMLTSYISLLAYSLLGSPFSIIIEICTVILILAAMTLFLRKPYFRILDAVDNNWWIFCSFPLLLSAILYTVIYYPDSFINRPESIPVIFLLFVLMFDFYIIIYRNIENIYELLQYRHDRDILLLQTDMQKKEFAAVIDKYQALQICRHDMRHHISILHSLISDGRIPEAKSYLNRLNEDLTETVIEQYCENYMINIILSTCISRARKFGITVHCVAAVPEDIPIDSVEIGVVLTNSMDNAIKACDAIQNVESRYIRIICKEHFEQIYIQITNTYAGAVRFEDGFPVSDQKNHGLGTRSIASIAHKYEGIFSFTAENSVFKTTVILNAPVA
ncbi:sensor histidine kinase [Parasporobacterium paucivorans]|uniref:GHKL domain-containing protein n=1 Tax=Parasporobacterium paucivorans DSM 15970 TaxID=1122934 RepID=A0A1M6HPV9_9FIRM|nr:sensor histidine kinase [Parasporobacterium paucivorans]SHJ24176.1 GHKL domain-containing protein [Parasporobacterium paucivorans DSM 15970]